VSEFKLNLLNRLHLIWEIITTRSGHKHSSSSKQLSTFQQGYSAGVEDERYNTKDLERQLAEYKTKEQKRNGASLNELMTWSVKELAELVVDLNDEHEDFERQLAEATNKLTRIESVCDGYKAMQSEYETDTEIPYWDIMNIIKGTTTKKFGYLKEKGDER